MWIVNIYKDKYNGLTSYSKVFDEEEDAFDFFEAEIKEEFDYEIKNGLVTDQEIQNIISNQNYTYEDDKEEIMMSIKEVYEEN